MLNENLIREYVSTVLSEIKKDERYINLLRTIWSGGKTPVMAQDIARKWIDEVEKDRGVAVSQRSVKEIYDYATLRFPGLLRRYKNTGSQDPVKSATQALQTMLDTKFGVLRVDV